MRNKTHSLTIRITLLICVLCVLGLNGCIGYGLGTTLPPDIRSVHVPTFVNETDEPQLEIRTTSATISELQKDGTLRIAHKDQADALLEVTLKKYEVIPIRYDRDESTTPKEHRIQITALVVLTKTADQKVLVDNHAVLGESTFEIITDLTSAKRRALPKAAKDLAHNVVESVVEYW